MIIAQLNDNRLFELTGRTVERQAIGFELRGRTVEQSEIGYFSGPQPSSLFFEVFQPNSNWWLGQQHVKAIWKTK